MSDDAKKKILLVDDDEIHLMATEAILMADYEIFTAKSGKEAVECFLRRRIPDLVLLDIMMPNMDGWETYHRLKAMSVLGNIPIAFFTSVTDAPERTRAQEMGAADYFTKPFDREDLLDRIKKIFEKK